MTINLPNELETSLRAEVLSGHFASEDDAVAAIVREYFTRKASRPAATVANGDLGSIGAMREDAELLDQAVEHAMRMRESRPWRLGSGE